MAMRHFIPEIDNDRIVYDANLVVPPVYGTPAVAVFRPGASLNGVVQTIRGSARVQVEAAVGSGKSTKLPAELYKATGKLVVHLVPSRLLAYRLFTYVSKEETFDTMFLEDTTTPMPTRGLVFMNSSTFVARAIERQFATKENRFYLYLDEAHESDAATAVLRDIGSAFPSVECLITASATFSPGKTRPRELSGKLVERTFTHVPPKDWDISDGSKPWGWSQFNGHGYMHVRNAAARARLKAEYAGSGLDVFELSVKHTTPAEDDKIRMHLLDPDSPCTVVFIDYGGRSGTTPEVANFVDDCEVEIMTHKNGMPHRTQRSCFEFEILQSSSRLSRRPGSVGTYSRPAYDPLAAMCDVEGAEVDVASLMFRLLGYFPPRKYKGQSPMVTGKVPKDISAALKSETPLPCLADSQLTEWGSGEKPPVIEVETPIGFRPSRPATPVDVYAVSKPEVQRVPTPPPVVQRKYSVERLDASALEFANARVQSVHVDKGVVSAVKPASGGLDMLEVSSCVKSGLPGIRYEDSGGSTDSSPIRGTTSPISPGVFQQPVDVDAVTSMFGDMLDAIDTGCGELEFGKYYYVTGMQEVEDTGMLFRDGAASVIRMATMHDGPALLGGLPYHEKMVAMRKILDAYNTTTVEVNGIKVLMSVLPDVKERLASITDPQALRKWVIGLSEEFNVAQARLSILATTYTYLARGKAREMDPLRDKELHVAQGYFNQLDKGVFMSDPGGAGRYRDELTGRIRPPALMPAMRGEVKKLQRRSVGPIMQTGKFIDDGRDEKAVRGRFKSNVGLRAPLAGLAMKLIGPGEMVFEIDK